MKYIGIRGHRGSGKKTISYLIGQVLNYHTEHNSLNISKDIFNEWCDKIVDNENIIYDGESKYVYYDGFGQGTKGLVQNLLGLEWKHVNDDMYKDKLYINMDSFENKLYDNPNDIQGIICTAPEYFQLINNQLNTTNIYMSLREFILYFGKEVMQRFFGKDVWVKSLSRNENYFIYGCEYRIFTDIKAPTELSYVKNKDGVIIKVTRKGHEKTGGINLLESDERYDYEVVINDNNLYSLRKQIIEIVKNIIK